MGSLPANVSCGMGILPVVGQCPTRLYRTPDLECVFPMKDQRFTHCLGLALVGTIGVGPLLAPLSPAVAAPLPSFQIAQAKAPGIDLGQVQQSLQQNPQLQEQAIQLLQQNPELVMQMMQELLTANPGLLTQLQQNPAFVQQLAQQYPLLIQMLQQNPAIVEQMRQILED